MTWWGLTLKVCCRFVPRKNPPQMVPIYGSKYWWVSRVWRIWFRAQPRKKPWLWTCGMVEGLEQFLFIQGLIICYWQNQKLPDFAQLWHHCPVVCCCLSNICVWNVEISLSVFILFLHFFGSLLVNCLFFIGMKQQINTGMFAFIDSISFYNLVFQS